MCKRRYYTYVNSNDPTIISNTIFTIFIKFDINYNNIYVKIIYIHIHIYKIYIYLYINVKIMSL